MKIQPKFNVNDKAVYNDSTSSDIYNDIASLAEKTEYTVSKVNASRKTIELKEIEGYSFDENLFKSLEFPYSLKKGDIVVYRGNDYIFIEYNRELVSPFVIVLKQFESAFLAGEKYEVTTVDAVYLKDKYKPYEEFNIEWLKHHKALKSKKNGHTYLFNSIKYSGQWVFTLRPLNHDDVEQEQTLKNLFDLFTELNNIPFGRKK